MNTKRKQTRADNLETLDLDMLEGASGGAPKVVEDIKAEYSSFGYRIVEWDNGATTHWDDNPMTTFPDNYFEEQLELRTGGSRG